MVEIVLLVKNIICFHRNIQYEMMSIMVKLICFMVNQRVIDKRKNGGTVLLFIGGVFELNTIDYVKKNDFCDFFDSELAESAYVRYFKDSF